MSKQEFLERLSEALREAMDDRSAYEHISYYSGYIDDEIRKGRSEEEVVSELGNPRLIAKSIIDRGGYTSSEASYTTYDTRRTGNGMSGDDGFEDKNQNVRFTINGNGVNPVIAKVVGAVVLIVILALVLLVLWGISWLVIKIVLPIVLVLFLAGLVIALIKSSKS